MSRDTDQPVAVTNCRLHWKAPYPAQAASERPAGRRPRHASAAGRGAGRQQPCRPGRPVRELAFMICRLWRGWATRDNADAYERIVRVQVIPGIEAQRIPGFCSIDLVRRERDHDVEFMTLMWFDTLDAVKAFMGEDYEVAHVPAEAQAVLADFDKRSAHYEVLDRRDQPG